MNQTRQGLVGRSNENNNNNRVGKKQRNKKAKVMRRVTKACCQER